MNQLLGLIIQKTILVIIKILKLKNSYSFKIFGRKYGKTCDLCKSSFGEIYFFIVIKKLNNHRDLKYLY